LAVESVHRALHPEARELVEPGGDRDQLTLPAMLGPTPDRGSSFSAKGNAGVEPPHESRPSHDPMELHSHAGSQEVWLQNHVVTVLAWNFRTQTTIEPIRSALRLAPPPIPQVFLITATPLNLHKRFLTAASFKQLYRTCPARLPKSTCHSPGGASDTALAFPERSGWQTIV